jgi:hypothetical protein
MLAGVSGSAFAADIGWGGGTDNWSNTNAWTGLALPGSGDTAFINNGTATINSDVGTVQAFHLGFNNGNTGTLNMSGGKLVASLNDSYVGRSSTSNSFGIFNMSGGTLQLGDATGSKRLIIGLDAASAPKTGTVTIDGGTFIGRFLVGSSSIAGATRDTLTINGDAAIIGATFTDGTAGGNYGLEMRSTADLRFNFNASGISGMTFTDDAKFSATSTILVDGSAYTGGSNTFTLINAASFYLLSGGATPVITLTNFANTASYNFDAANGNFTVSVIPEPATLGLFMLSGGFLMVLRHHLRK